MKAIVQNAYGSTDTLHLRDIDRPVPRDDEVLVEVRAAGVDPSVWHLMTGRPYIARLSPQLGLRRPAHTVRGWDAAGRVEAVGAEVTGFFYADDKVRLRRAMREAGLQEVRFRFDFEGTKLIAQS